MRLWRRLIDRLLWRMVLFMVAFEVVDIGMLFPTIGVVRLLHLPDDAVRYIAPVLVAPGILVLVICFWRFIDCRGWPSRSDLGLSLSGRAALQLLAGLALSGLVIAVASAVAVATGSASVAVPRWDNQLLLFLVMDLVFTSLLLQGFPEELAFRGYLLGNLVRSLPMWLALSSTTLLFGSIHLLSNPPHVVTAIALGLLLTASRIASGSLWLPIGIHAGYDFFGGSGVSLLHSPGINLLDGALFPWVTLSLTAAAALMLAARQRCRPVDWWVRPARASRLGGQIREPHR
jgi:membrane protease YdiL (CAAX protease family)